jgi:hypothetical protein
MAKSTSPKGALSFEWAVLSAKDSESIVLNLLATHLREQGKEIILYPPDLRFVDAFMPEGFDEYEGRTVL